MEVLTDISLQKIEHVPHLTHLPKRPEINIEFQDLTYTVPQGRKGSKIILRSINGLFQSGQLTAILGPSGAGKSTLLNILAGYKCRGATGNITVNGVPRDPRRFRAISRYIMQEDLLQPFLTVNECMMIAADLKLGYKYSSNDKKVASDEILDMLRLSKAKNTTTDKLSGGEKKRLSIALELVNNPPVIFLDEPTSGLDDLSSSQCVSLLKLLAQGGRTVICSIHTPSARLFEQFDHVYVIAAGQCVFQGLGKHIVPFVSNIGLDCPMHYNPADFVIEVSSGEYGDFIDKMVSAIDNGKCLKWKPYDNVEDNDICNQLEHNQNQITLVTQVPITIEYIEEKEQYFTSSWRQFQILLHRKLLQMWRDSNYLLIKAGMYIFLGFIIGSLFWRMGNDGSKTLFNFGFCFTCIIVFLYVPMLPVLLYFPTEVQLLKREHFNRWYNLNAYFCAMTIATLPAQIILGSIYIFLVYIITDQPLEIDRIAMFYTVCILIALISESLGLVISSQLNILNGMFVGPAMSVPLMLLAVYGLGTGSENIPIHIRAAMSLSFLRYGLEGIVIAMYGGNRPDMPCPYEEDFCQFRNAKQLMSIMGMENVVYWIDLTALIICFILFRMISYYLLRQRLSPNKTFAALNYIGRIVKSQLSQR